MESRGGACTMRILRLFAPSLIGDHTLCYVHCNSSGLSCINEVPVDITYVCVGEDISTEFYSHKMTIVLPPGTSLEDGDFLAAAGGEQGGDVGIRVHCGQMRGQGEIAPAGARPRGRRHPAGPGRRPPPRGFRCRNGLAIRGQPGRAPCWTVT